MNNFGPEVEALFYLQDAEVAGWNTSQTFMYEKFGSDIISNLIIESMIGYGDHDTFILTEIGKELVMDIMREEEPVNGNYTHPDDLGHDDEAADWLASALIFANALGHLLRENEGIVVKLKNDMLKLKIIPETTYGKVIVYNYNDQVHVVNCDQDLKEGQMIWMHHEKDEDE